MSRERTPSDAAPPAFAPVVRSLRDALIEHCQTHGPDLGTPSGLRTLDTNSTLAAARGRLLLRLLAEAGSGPVAGRRLLDVGAGFGSLALYFGHLGAEVVAVDPNADRLRVAARVGEAHGLSVSARQGYADALPATDRDFDFVVVNNALCYVIEPERRRAALEEILRVLKPGGWLVVRDPNGLTPVDPFTGLPGLAILPPRLADATARRLGRHRSRVRLNGPLAAAREVREAGFVRVRWQAYPSSSAVRWLRRYHHVTARRPGAGPAADSGLVAAD